MRNPECRYYPKCHDTAARLDQALDCSECRDHDDHTGRDEPQELFGHVLLLVAIFFPEAYSVYRSITDPVIRQRVQEYLMELFEAWNADDQHRVVKRWR